MQAVEVKRRIRSYRKRGIVIDRDYILNRTLVNESTGCWEWRDFKKYGYGEICIRKKVVKVHRLSYELWVGSIPEGYCVLHQCDVRSCCNPWHMFIGTRADNVADMHRKGRHRTRSPQGADHPGAKFTEMGVRLVRKCELPVNKIASILGVSGVTIYSIRSRKSYPLVV